MQGVNALAVNLFIGYTVGSLTSFGLLLENDQVRGCAVEWLRCVLFLTADSLSLMQLPFDGASEAIRGLFYLSTVVWSAKILQYGKSCASHRPKVD
jgi:hypothetical protein